MVIMSTVRRRPRLPIVMEAMMMHKTMVPPVVVMPPVMAIARIHHDHAPSPVAIVTEPPTHAETHAKRNPRIRPINHRTLNKDNLRIVTRHIHHIRLRRHDANVFSLGHHLLLRRAHQQSLRFRPRPHALDRCHHFFWFIEIRVSQLPRPRKVLVHPLHHVRITRQPFHAVVPGLPFDLRLRAASLQKTRRQHHVRALDRRRKYQRHQHVRIQRNRRNQLLHLI